MKSLTFPFSSARSIHFAFCERKKKVRLQFAVTVEALAVRQSFSPLALSFRSRLLRQSLSPPKWSVSYGTSVSL